MFQKSSLCSYKGNKIEPNSCDNTEDVMVEIIPVMRILLIPKESLFKVIAILKFFTALTRLNRIDTHVRRIFIWFNLIKCKASI